jgi:hypothetical protein
VSKALKKAKTAVKKGYHAIKKGLRKKMYKKCPGHCLEDCRIEKSFLDKSCKAPKSMLRAIAGKIRYKGHQTWNVLNDRSGDQTDAERVIGTVTCPCSHNGKSLNEEEALQRILGQVSVIEAPTTFIWDGGGLSKFAKSGGKSFTKTRRRRGISTAMKVSYSTHLLLKCWKKRCAAPQDMDSFLDLGWGGGAAC